MRGKEVDSERVRFQKDFMRRFSGARSTPLSEFQGWDMQNINRRSKAASHKGLPVMPNDLSKIRTWG